MASWVLVLRGLFGGREEGLRVVAEARGGKYRCASRRHQKNDENGSLFFQTDDSGAELL